MKGVYVPCVRKCQMLGRRAEDKGSKSLVREGHFGGMCEQRFKEREEANPEDTGRVRGRAE